MVSVIITTYGANVKLVKAVESVLNQSYKDIEVLVVDDNNPDSKERQETEKLMKRYANKKNVHYLKHQQNMNGAAARNTGIKYAKGEYIAFLDDDDLYLPERIETAVAYLREHQDLDGVCQEVVKVNNNYLVDLMQVRNGKIMTIDDLIISSSGLGSGSNIFLKRKIIDDVDGFDIKFNRKQDIEFILRILIIGKLAYLHDIQIVKDVSGVRKLSYKSNRNALQYFNKKYKEQIEKLSKDGNKEYFIKQYYFLYNIAKLSGDKKTILFAANELLHYDISARKKIIYANITAIKYKIINMMTKGRLGFLIIFLKNRRYAIKNYKIKNLIKKDKYNQINEALRIKYIIA